MATQQQLTIPMFPLNMVILPGETKTLHIYEERYKQLVSDCITNEAHFGIPFVHQKSVGDYGIEVKINHIIKTYDNGEMDILIEGVKVFKMMEFSSVLSPKLYGAGIIHQEQDINTKASVLLQNLVKQYLWLAQQSTVQEDAFDNANVYSIARLLDISSSEKYELIKAETPAEKENLLKSKIKLFIHLIKTENELQAKFILN
jgi:Lon protease-like protein